MPCALPALTYASCFMQTPKLIVSDLDGTLLPDSKILSGHARSVLQRLAGQGVRIALASGKFFHLTEVYADQLGPETAVVALDGARNRFAAGELEICGIAREVALELLDRHDAPHLEMFSDNGNDEILLRFRGPGIPATIQQWASRIHRVSDARAHIVGDPALLAFYGPDAEELEGIAKDAEARYPELRTAVYPMSSYGTARVVIQQRRITKGSGVVACCAHFGVSPQETMVFGDWYNDLSMFAAGCVNVATANAMPEVKAQADFITDLDCNADGVAHFLAERFL